MKKASPPLINDDGEVRYLSAKDKVSVSMLRDTSPKLAEYSQKRKAGRPKIAAPKRSKSFKLSPALIDAIVASGKGYNARVEKALFKALEKGWV